jgi:hypothetical protein
MPESRQYNVYVQDAFYKVMSGEYTSDVLRQVTIDINEGKVDGFDPAEPHSIRIEPQ